MRISVPALSWIYLYTLQAINICLDAQSTMPELNHLACTVRLGATRAPFTEYNLQYSNKHASCYICVADYETNISVSLKSSGYIGPGLAAFVFIDGQYQANRNKTGLDNGDANDDESVAISSSSVDERKV